MPNITLAVFLLALAIYLVVNGVILAFESFVNKRARWSGGVLLLIGGFGIGTDGIWLILAGILAILFGFYTFSNPEKGALALLSFIGMFSLASGLLYIIAAFKTKKFAKKMPGS